LAKSGIALDNGVVVNEYLEASEPGVYAAGDVANYPGLIFEKRRRVEHWDNAVSQASTGRELYWETVSHLFMCLTFSPTFLSLL
jgi:NADPH-dependent 2,4-dienoyl-CoA reductase/sulfur reductase-like enzyme